MSNRTSWSLSDVSAVVNEGTRAFLVDEGLPAKTLLFQAAGAQDRRVEQRGARSCALLGVCDESFLFFVDTKEGSVLLGSEGAQDAWPVNNSLSTFVESLTIADQEYPYYSADADSDVFAVMAGRLEEVLLRIDPVAYLAEGSFWKGFVHDVSIGDYSTEDVDWWSPGPELSARERTESGGAPGSEPVAEVMHADDDLALLSPLAVGDRQMVAALLLVRYCGFHRDPKFSPWFEGAREALADVVGFAGRLVRQNSSEALDGLREKLDRVLEDSDPDGPPFETEVVDHLVFATEVLACVATPDDVGVWQRAFGHADELAESHEEMGLEDYAGGDWEPVDFDRRESRIRSLDIRALTEARAAGTVVEAESLLSRSEEFAAQYADVIEHCCTEEEAGRS
jgi:hypothetical protein